MAGVARGVEERVGVHAECRGQFGEHGLVPDEVDRPESAGLRQGDQGTSDAGVRGVLHDPVPGPQVGVLAQDQTGRGRIDAQHRELLDAAFRQSEQPVGGQQQPLAPGTGEQRQNHQVARRERVDAGARLDNPADTLAAEDQRERWPPELAPDDLEVVQVQR